MTRAGSAGRWEGLKPRVAAGAALAAVALASDWLGGAVFALVWLAAGVVVMFEWVKVTRSTRPVLVCGIAGAGAAQVALAAGRGDVALVLAVAALVASALTQPRRPALAAGGVLAAGAVALCPVLLRDSATGGAAAVLWLFAVVWGTDVAAYFTGRSFGGPKLWPAVSPGKTWSGALGGALAAVVLGLVVAVTGGFASPGTVAVLSLAASVASQCGDLGESALKRGFGVKDSGSLIPGHGGLMDRLDGFAPAAALAVLADLLGAPLA